MTDNKLTDKEIVQAYEFCLKSKCCIGCVADTYSKTGERDCKLKPQDITDLINRLQAENERLEIECDKQYEIAQATIRAEIADGGTSCHWCEDTIRGVAKAEAYKEFAERLKEKKARYNADNFFVIDYIPFKEIDNLLKELVGEDK